MQRYLERVAALEGAVAVSEQGWPQERDANGSCSRGEHPAASAGAAVRSWSPSLLILLERFSLLWWSLDQAAPAQCV